MKQIKNRFKKVKGFTLFELIIVVAILGVMAALTVQYLTQRGLDLNKEIYTDQASKEFATVSHKFNEYIALNQAGWANDSTTTVTIANLQTANLLPANYGMNGLDKTVLGQTFLMTAHKDASGAVTGLVSESGAILSERLDSMGVKNTSQAIESFKRGVAQTQENKYSASEISPALITSGTAEAVGPTNNYTVDISDHIASPTANSYANLISFPGVSTGSTGSTGTTGASSSGGLIVTTAKLIDEIQNDGLYATGFMYGGGGLTADTTSADVYSACLSYKATAGLADDQLYCRSNGEIYASNKYPVDRGVNEFYGNHWGTMRFEIDSGGYLTITGSPGPKTPYSDYRICNINSGSCSVGIFLSIWKYQLNSYYGNGNYFSYYQRGQSVTFSVTQDGLLISYTNSTTSGTTESLYVWKGA